MLHWIQFFRLAYRQAGNMSLLKPVFSGLYSHFAVMAELADAADLGSVVFNVQVQILLTALYQVFVIFFIF